MHIIIFIICTPSLSPNSICVLWVKSQALSEDPWPVLRGMHSFPFSFLVMCKQMETNLLQYSMEQMEIYFTQILFGKSLPACAIWAHMTYGELRQNWICKGKKIKKAAACLGSKFHNKGMSVDSGLTFIASLEPEWDRLLGQRLLNEHCLGGVCRTHYLLVLSWLWCWNMNTCSAAHCLILPFKVKFLWWFHRAVWPCDA